MNEITLINYTEVPLNRKEIYRYAGCKTSASELDNMIDEALLKAREFLTYRVCYRVFPISKCIDELDLGFVKTRSENLAKNLDGCDEIVLFCATLGMEFERMLNMTSLLSPSKALILQAIGDERVESLCDKFNKEITDKYTEEHRSTKPRFSPGYGDLPLSIQKDISTSLALPSSIGVSLGESYFMTPSKSVTAIIGISSAKGK